MKNVLGSESMETEGLSVLVSVNLSQAQNYRMASIQPHTHKYPLIYTSVILNTRDVGYITEELEISHYFCVVTDSDRLAKWRQIYI